MIAKAPKQPKEYGGRRNGKSMERRRRSVQRSTRQKGIQPKGKKSMEADNVYYEGVMGVGGTD
jgi:hypothetical protein